MARHWRWVAALAVVLALGCVWLVREGRGQAPARPPQWEYAAENTLSADDPPKRRDAILKAWNKLGAEGWEMCAAERGFVIFKRLKR
jgi:hypothetical protein